VSEELLGALAALLLALVNEGRRQLDVYRRRHGARRTRSSD